MTYDSMMELALCCSVPRRTVTLFSELITFQPSIFGRPVSSQHADSVMLRDAYLMALPG